MAEPQGPLLLVRATPDSSACPSNWREVIRAQIAEFAGNQSIPQLDIADIPDGVSIEIGANSESDLALIIAHLRQSSRSSFTTMPISVAFREIIRARASGVGRASRDLGSAPGTAKCIVEVEPRPLGTSVLITAERGIAPDLQSAAAAGITEALKGGIQIGRPVVGIAVNLMEAEILPGDYSSLLPLAAKAALRAACERASPYLVEPIMSCEVIVAESITGDVIGDLNSRRARINDMKDVDQLKCISCTVPLSEMIGYDRFFTELQSFSSKATAAKWSMALAHWGEIPMNRYKAIMDSHRSDDPPAAGAGRAVKPIRPRPGRPGGQAKPLPPEN